MYIIDLTVILSLAGLDSQRSHASGPKVQYYEALFSVKCTLKKQFWSDAKVLTLGPTGHLAVLGRFGTIAILDSTMSPGKLVRNRISPRYQEVPS